MIKQLLLCALVGFGLGVAVYFGTAVFTGFRKTARLPFGGVGTGVFAGITLHHGLPIVPTAILMGLAALVGHIVMVWITARIRTSRSTT